MSIIIPAYNAARFIGAALTGALQQTYPWIEVVVVDDGSSDQTADIVDAHGDLVTLVRQDNQGPGSARNTAIAASTGEILCFCDADDILLPTHVAMAVTTLQAAPPRTWVSSDAAILAGVPVSLRGAVHTTLPAPRRQSDTILRSNFVSIFSTVPRALVEEVGPFDESLKACEDWDLWVRAIGLGWRVAFQRTPTAMYRRSAGTLSRDDGAMTYGTQVVLGKVESGASAGFSRRQRTRLRNRLSGPTAHQVLRSADESLRLGQSRSAGRLYWSAAQAMPRDPRLTAKALALMVVPSTGRWWRDRMTSST